MAVKYTSKMFKKIREEFTGDRDNRKRSDYNDRVAHLNILIEKLEHKEELDLCFRTSKKDKDVSGMYEMLCEMCENGLITATDPRIDIDGKVMAVIATEYGEEEQANLFPNETALGEFEDIVHIVENEFADEIEDAAPKQRTSGASKGTRKKSEPREIKSPKQIRDEMQLFDSRMAKVPVETYRHLLVRLEYGQEGREVGNALGFDAYLEEIPTLPLLENVAKESSYERKYIGKFIPYDNVNFQKKFREGDAAVLDIHTDHFLCSYPLKRVGIAVAEWERTADDKIVASVTVKLNVEEFLELRVLLGKTMSELKKELAKFCSTHKGEPVEAVDVKFTRSCIEGVERQKTMRIEDEKAVVEFIIEHRNGLMEAEAAAKLKAEEKAKAAMLKEERKAEREARKQEAEEKAKQNFQSDLDAKISAKMAELGRPLTKDEILALFDPELVAQIKGQMNANQQA